MLGKYDSYRDSVLHYLCTSDWANESDGNSSDYGVYFWRISNTWEDVKPENEEFNSLMEDIAAEGIELTEDLRRQMVGHFLVSESDTGAVNVRQFETEGKLLGRYQDFAEHYASWAEQGDEEDSNN
jgi:hypothetical protein